jgi:hypothetical protein
VTWAALRAPDDQDWQIDISDHEYPRKHPAAEGLTSLVDEVAGTSTFFLLDVRAASVIPV